MLEGGLFETGFTAVVSLGRERMQLCREPSQNLGKCIRTLGAQKGGHDLGVFKKCSQAGAEGQEA